MQLVVVEGPWRKRFDQEIRLRGHPVEQSRRHAGIPRSA